MKSFQKKSSTRIVNPCIESVRGPINRVPEQHPIGADGVRPDWDTFVAACLLTCGDTRQRWHADRWFRADEAGGLHFLVMEYVEGRSLADLVSERGLLPAAEACAYVGQAALGLRLATRPDHTGIGLLSPRA